jgi:SAM-dependent methyltransferase
VRGWYPEVDLPDGSFDVVSLQDCLEHLTDPPAALARVRELLRPGGALLVTTPNTRSWLARLQGTSWLSLKFPEHVVLYDAASLSRALAEAGFRVRRMVPAGQVARLDFLVSRAFGAWPRLRDALVAIVRALGGGRVRLYVPSGSLAVVATVDVRAAVRDEPHARRA